MSEQARAAIGSETIEAVADRRYYTGQARDRSPAATLGRPPMSPAAAGWEPVDRRQCMGGRGGPMKPFSPTAKSSRNRPRLSCSFIKQRGFDHVVRHPQCNLPPFPQSCPLRHGSDPGSAPMTEIVTATLVFLGISVFLAHAFDAYRTG
jgi:hypothetical protein